MNFPLKSDWGFGEMTPNDPLPACVDEWAASFAHEVNQPLAAIVTNAESCLAWLGKEQPDLDRARKAAERIVRTGHHASGVVRSIRAMLRKSPPNLAPLDINALIADVLDIMRAEIREHDVTLETQLCRDVGRLSGDRIQLQQVLVNLLRNGIESMFEAEVSPLRILRVSTSLECDGTVQIAVADSGIGLDAATVGRIFDPFFTTKTHGTGLGLSICRTIVHGHGGQLWATPRIPRGSIFQFTLPSSQPTRSRARSGDLASPLPQL
jgi:signal transduction histidine kinase